MPLKKELWSVRVSPKQNYTRTLPDFSSLHVTRASLPDLPTTPNNNTSPKTTTLWIQFQDKITNQHRKILACTLRSSIPASEISLRLHPDTSFSFISEGGDIHLLGTLNQFGNDDLEDEEMEANMELENTRDNDSHTDTDSELSEFDEDELFSRPIPVRQKKKDIAKKDKSKEVKESSTKPNVLEKKDAPSRNQQEKSKEPKESKEKENPPQKGSNKNTKAQSDDPKSKPKSNVRTLTNGLKIADLELGNGKNVVKGRQIVIKYKGSLESGKIFDKSANFKFRAGVGDVVAGMDQGVDGMKEGGKRRVTIPSSLGYGKRGAPPDIPPNATLIFEIELCKVL